MPGTGHGKMACDREDLTISRIAADYQNRSMGGRGLHNPLIVLSDRPG
jgi:hypothetical protein